MIEASQMPARRGYLLSIYRGLVPALIFLVLAAVVFAAIQLVFGAFYLERMYDEIAPPAGDAVKDIIFRLQLIVALVAASLAASALFRHVRGPEPQGSRFRLLAGGAVVGLTAMGLVAALGWATSTIDYSPAGLGSRAWLAAATAIGVAGLVSLSEELFCRGFLLRALSSGFGRIAAALGTSLFFIVLHLGNNIAEPLWYFNVLLFGLVFAGSVFLFGSIAWAVGFHALWNFTQSYVLGLANSGQAATESLLPGVPDGPILLSGGAAGPEGSLYTTTVLLLILALLARHSLRGRSRPSPAGAG